MKVIWRLPSLLFATVFFARPAVAQYDAPAGVRHSAPSGEFAFVRGTPAPAHQLVQISAKRVAHGVLIGAGVGAAAGLIAAAVTPHSSSADNAEGFIAFAAIGAFFGMVVGAAVGASR